MEWSSVLDRLPKRMANKVIVCCKNGYVGFGHYEDYKGEKTWYNLESGKPFSAWDVDEDDDHTVTHWMPLPEPPKEDVAIETLLAERGSEVAHAHCVINWLGDCHCSNCGESIDCTSNYCNRCGAKLDEPEQRED